jgi:hypothetical protein
MNDKWRYSAVSVTAYSPVYEDIRERPIISFGDVGKSMTLNEYFVIENAYIEAVKIIMRLNNCTELKIRYLEQYKNYSQEEVNKWHGNLHDTYLSITDNKIVILGDLEPTLRLILRNFMWCDLVNLSKRLYVRFGYDYYMYFNTKIKVDVYKDEIEKLGLYVEE